VQAWWFEISQPHEAMAVIAAPSRIVAGMEAPSWQVNQDVDHLGAAFRLERGCLAFVARDRAALADAMRRASRDVRIFSMPRDGLALRLDVYDCGVAQRPGRLPAGAIGLVARRRIFAALGVSPTGLQGHSITVRRLGALIGVMPG
jgi:hypothetical protein